MVEKAKQLGISLTVQERAPVVPKDSKAVKDVKESKHKKIIDE